MAVRPYLERLRRDVGSGDGHPLQNRLATRPTTTSPTAAATAGGFVNPRRSFAAFAFFDAVKKSGNLSAKAALSLSASMTAVPFGVKPPMKPNQKPDAADFMEKWLAHNIAAHPVPQDLASVVRALTHNCLDAAALAGISAAEIELRTGLLAADHIQKAIDNEIAQSRRKPSGPPPEKKAVQPGRALPPAATVILRQPEPPPYRLPARSHH